jgi:hypothetical protein
MEIFFQMGGDFMEYVFWSLAIISFGIICGYYLGKWFLKS